MVRSPRECGLFCFLLRTGCASSGSIKFDKLTRQEINHEDLLALTDRIVERGAPATAVHTRKPVLQIFRWAIERGQKVDNPAELVRTASITRFEPHDRALTPGEIGLDVSIH